MCCFISAYPILPSSKTMEVVLSSSSFTSHSVIASKQDKASGPPINSQMANSRLCTVLMCSEKHIFLLFLRQDNPSSLFLSLMTRRGMMHYFFFKALHIAWTQKKCSAAMSTFPSLLCLFQIRYHQAANFADCHQGRWFPQSRKWWWGW